MWFRTFSVLAAALALAGAGLLARATGAAQEGSVEVIAAGLREIVPEGAKIEKIAGGFQFTEGPIWYDGALLFSDIPNNVILKWEPGAARTTDFRRPSNHTNGNTLDPQGRLVCCEHSGRRVSRRERDGTYRTIVERYNGKRLNSPNDAVYHATGALYFTDPPYGLPQQDRDAAKELPFNGVYRFHEGRLTLLTDELKRPNGLAFSPDELTLYVANSDAERKIWMAYPVKIDGTLGRGRIFFNVTGRTEPGLPDGMKVDRQGNLYCTGPGGVWIFSPDGKHLGTIRPPEVPANCHWGDADGKTLYMTARSGVYRIRLKIPGVRPEPKRS